MPLFGDDLKGMVDQILQVFGTNIVRMLAESRDAGTNLLYPHSLTRKNLNGVHSPPPFIYIFIYHVSCIIPV